MIDTEDSRVDDALLAIRDVVRRQLGHIPSGTKADPESLIRFADDLPTAHEPDEVRRLAARAAELEPWLQGPFLLGGDLIVGGVWRNDQRWMSLSDQVDASLTGKRVLDVGSNAGYDAFMFKRRGADYVLACEPFAFYEQALFLESIYRSGVDFQRLPWQALNPRRQGTFDLVHCHGLLYHEPNPMLLLQRLRSMLAPQGEMLIGSMMLADPEQSEYLRFVPGSHCGDDTWWFVPGRLALRWMLEVNGLRVVYAFGDSPGPVGDFPVVNGYYKVVGCDPAPHLEPPPSHA